MCEIFDGESFSAAPAAEDDLVCRNVGFFVSYECVYDLFGFVSDQWFVGDVVEVEDGVVDDGFGFFFERGSFILQVFFEVHHCITCLLHSTYKAHYYLKFSFDERKVFKVACPMVVLR